MDLRPTIATLSLAACTLCAVSSSGRAVPRAITRPAQASAHSVDRHLDVNRVNLAVTNLGIVGGDLATYQAGLWYPADSLTALLYASGLWLGAIVGPDTLVTVAEYAQEFVPGPIAGGLPAGPDGPGRRVWKVSRWTGDPQDTAHVERTPAFANQDPLVHHSWSEYVAGAVPDGAPWRLHRLPDTGTPDPSDSVDVPGPDVVGDQMTWCVFDDADASAHTNIIGHTAPLLAEVEQTVFGFDAAGPVGDAAYVHWRVHNRGTSAWTMLRAGLWADPDLMFTGNDHVGCDSARAMGYAYNVPNGGLGDGDPPTVLGIVLLDGPPGGDVPLHAFRGYFNGSDPSAAQGSYRFLAGLLGDGSALVPPGGVSTRLQFSGDPVAGTGWLDTIVGDKRMLESFAPRDVAPGASFDLWAAWLVSPGASVTDALVALGPRADTVRAGYDNGFRQVAGVGPAGERRVALAGFRPNPATGSLSVDFTLAAHSPARFEVFDLAGRRLYGRRVTPGAAGRFVLPLGDLRLAPGLYLLRLEQGGQTAVARGVVLN